MAYFVRVSARPYHVRGATLMNKTTRFQAISRAALGLFTGMALFGSVKAQTAGVEETFPVLTIGTQTYTNVTVTTKAKNYVMLMHSTGLANIKVSELTPELRDKLGYGPPPEPKLSKSAEVTKWAKQKMAALNITQVQALEANFKQKWAERSSGGDLSFVNNLPPRILYCAAGGHSVARGTGGIVHRVRLVVRMHGKVHPSTRSCDIILS
jgi:hypothetical protein